MEGPLACRVRVSAAQHEFVASSGAGGTYLVTANATRVANTHGGAQSRRVTVRLYPSVAVMVGKNALNEREVMRQVMLRAAVKLDAR